MAMTGGNHSPRHSSDDHQSRSAARLPVSSPWNQVVRGESEPVAAAPSSPSSSTAVGAESFPSASVPVGESSYSAEGSDNSGGHNGGAVKRPAWNKHSSNGAASLEVRPVMDAVSWPALSASAKLATTKPESSSKGLLDGSSVPQLQVWFFSLVLRLLQSLLFW